MTSVIDFFEKTKRATERILGENKDRVKIIFDYIVVIASMFFLVWASLNIGQSMPTMVTIGFAYMGFIIANKLSPSTSVLLIVFVVAAFKSNETDDTIEIIVANAAVIISYAVIFFMEIKERNSFYKERLNSRNS